MTKHSIEKMAIIYIKSNIYTFSYNTVYNSDFFYTQK